MSKKLDLLKQSLLKKEQQLEHKFTEHFNAVKQTNGQPLNDKRNGQATLNKFERQNDGIRNIIHSIEKTKKAIDLEEDKINGVGYFNKTLPDTLLTIIKEHDLKQWRKYPDTFFINGIEKARIKLDVKKKKVYSRYEATISSQEQKNKFRTICLLLLNEIQK